MFHLNKVSKKHNFSSVQPYPREIFYKKKMYRGSPHPKKDSTHIQSFLDDLGPLLNTTIIS